MNIKDIKIKTEKDAFKFRVAGIIEKDNKILVTKMRDNDFYCFPGGHVEMLEDAMSAANRELGEELFFKFKLKKLLYIHENFFKHRNKNFHELCFYYSGRPVGNTKKLNNSLKQEEFIWEEIDNGEKLYHHFKWIGKKDIDKFDIRPKEIVNSFIKNKNKFVHFCTREN